MTTADLTHSRIVPRSVERADWDADVIYRVEMHFDVSTSDAQGILAIQRSLLDRCFAGGLTPEESADCISKSETAG